MCEVLTRGLDGDCSLFDSIAPSWGLPEGAPHARNRRELELLQVLQHLVMLPPRRREQLVELRRGVGEISEASGGAFDGRG